MTSQRKSRKKLAFSILAIAIVGYVFLAGHVSKELTESDVAAIKKLSVDLDCKTIGSFGAEVACIKAIQSQIRNLIPNNTCALKRLKIEPLDFLNRQYGCCYDRARFTEKALIYYGFKTRHVAIYDLTDHGYLGIFLPNIPSHATSEVLTSNGWMGVDSNEPFILLTEDNQALTFKNFKQHIHKLQYQVGPENFYKKDLFFIYGLFSRHGMFHGPNLPAPEFNFGELLQNI